MSALTRSPRTGIYGTVGTSAVVVLTANKAVNFLKVHNPSETNFLAVTYDGSVPVIQGVGTTLFPGGTETCDTHIPTGVVTIVGSASGSPYTIEWA